MQGLKTNKQKKLCPAIVYVVVWGDGKQELKTYLTLHIKKKKKKLYRCTKFSMSRSSWTKMKR